MPSSRSSRQPPDRTFENYILTLSIDNDLGLLKVPQEKFSQVPGPPGDSGNDDNTSDPLNIGFPFQFDGITYHQFMVSTNGWVILVDPATPAGTANGTIVADVMVNTYINALINSLFTRNHALFAIWYDDLRNTYSSPQSLGLTSTQINLYEKGINQPDRRVNPRKYGVQYYLENNSNEGRRLIIRWNCLSDFSIPNSILQFEFVLYENGKIEYRYAQRDTIGSSTVNEDATIGVFMHKSTWRFRDFSYELGYGTSRPRYSLGGAIYNSSYSDTEGPYTVPYGVGLKPETYWPGQKSAGAVFTFRPPLNRRKVLPRLSIKERDARTTLPTTARTGDRDRSGSDGIRFDDRKSIAYSTNALINYPTTLPRFYAQNLFGVARNQDLFLEDFVLTGTIRSSNVQEYLEDNEKKFISPFSEYKLFENDPAASSDSFFTSGSSIQDVGEGFSQPLKSKTQIRLSFRVDHKTTLFGASSSIYYFNSKTGRWQYPTASFMNGGFDIANPYSDAFGGRTIEVDRGFNAFGFNLVSGSNNNRSGNDTGTDPLIGKNASRENEISAISKSYNKSIQVDSRYSAIDNETISLPINHPFLIEKAVIELPIEAGPGWFNDKTKCFIPITDDNSPLSYDELNDAFDVGGPGITFALYNQISIGPNKTRRDLILSGTFTHEFDNIAEIAFSNSPDILAGASEWYNGAGAIWQLVPRGFKAYATPSSVVYASNQAGNYFYTGSVQLKCTAEISNGILVRDSFVMAQGFDLDDGESSPNLGAAKNTLDLLFSSSNLKFDVNLYSLFGYVGGPNGSNFRRTNILSINNFGRGALGFEPSGFSILGKEYTTFDYHPTYENPFYLYQGTSTLTDLKNSLPGTGGGADVVIASTTVNRSKSIASPYLVFPGDKLILSVSKSRPIFFSTLVSSPYTSGSLQHDVKLTTGSINITLYGSLVANGFEFHDTLNQELSTDAIHDVVVGGTKTW